MNYILKPSIDLYPGIRVDKDTKLEFKTENVEQTIEDLKLHSVTKVKGDGFDVIMSNNMAKDSTHAYCDIRGKKAIAFAGQINEVEAMRSEAHFADLVRGLDTFGAKVIDEARIQTVKIPLKA